MILRWNQGQVLLHAGQHPLSLTSVKMKRDKGKPNKYLKTIIVLEVEMKVLESHTKYICA